MLIRKVLSYKLVCPHCGAEISVSADEYNKYRKATEDYAGSEITSLEENEKGEKEEVNYVNFHCPVCKDYIPVTVCWLESDKFGFKVSKHVEVSYSNYDIVDIDEHIRDFLGPTEEG